MPPGNSLEPVQRRTAHRTRPFSVRFQQKPQNVAHNSETWEKGSILFLNKATTAAKYLESVVSFHQVNLHCVRRYSLWHIPQNINQFESILLVLHAQSTDQANGCQSMHKDEEPSVVGLHLASNSATKK